MTTTTQQISSNPAQRLADKIRARTNDTRDLIDLLHDIAQGGYDATTNDQQQATRILFDRGYGKCPKQTPASGAQTSSPAPAPSSDEPKADCEPESSRLVTQLDNSLHQSIGPAPKIQTPSFIPANAGIQSSGVGGGHTQRQDPISPEPFTPSSIQSIIQEHVVAITNDGDTLVNVLMGMAYADPDDPEASPETHRRVTAYHRKNAARILLDRGAGTSCAPALAVAPCDTPDTTDPIDHSPEEEPFDKEVWDGIIAELNQLEKDNNLDPNRPASEIDLSFYLPPDDSDLSTDIDEEAAKFNEMIDLRLERRKQWPEIEERRRKKLAQIYPSHSDDDPPET